MKKYLLILSALLAAGCNENPDNGYLTIEISCSSEFADSAPVENLDHYVQLIKSDASTKFGNTKAKIRQILPEVEFFDENYRDNCLDYNRDDTGQPWSNCYSILSAKIRIESSTKQQMINLVLDFGCSMAW